jgi:hypothetical protein
LPDLNWFERKTLANTELKPLLKKEWVSFKKNTEDYQGPYYEVNFKGEGPTGVYYDLKQKKECCYFEIEVLKLNGDVEIGFAHVDSREKIETGDEAVALEGVTISTSGCVVANGENLYNYNWALDYGDVIGIGLTQENDKFNERRAWVSKNGILLNLPPYD